MRFKGRFIEIYETSNNPDIIYLSDTAKDISIYRSLSREPSVKLSIIYITSGK